MKSLLKSSVVAVASSENQNRGKERGAGTGAGETLWRLVIAGLLIMSVPTVVLAQSALDGFDPGANNYVNAFAVQADGKILVGGSFTTLGGGGTGTTPRNRIGRLNVDGSLDTTFNPGANDNVITLAVQADGKILVGGAFTALGGGGTGTTPRSRIGRLNADGSLDMSFDPGANGQVYALAVQADGKILVGGAFTALGGGGAGTTPRNRIGRLNADGSLDTSFDPGAGGFYVYTLAVQADGKILVGGFFETLAGSTRRSIGRLNVDGTLDTSFNPGANAYVYSLAVQADGKIVVGGQFTSMGGGGFGVLRKNIGRIGADGSVDTSFDPGADYAVMTLAVQTDGKILVGGHFTALGGGGTGVTARSRIGRLQADGSLDASFDPGANDVVTGLGVQADGKILAVGGFTTLGGGGAGTTSRNRVGRFNADSSLETIFNPGADGTVHALAVQADGKILVGGNFVTLGGGGTGTIPRCYIGRLQADGGVDTSFDPGANNLVLALAVQADGKILVGGRFTTLGGGGAGLITRNYIGRLHADGSVDASFNPGADAFVYALAVQADGKILVGGYFSALGGGGTGTTARNYIGRLNADGSLDTSFDPGANRDVVTLAVQADGKILVGGSFTTLGGGGTGTIPRNRIGRLHADGSLDMSFDPGANDNVHTLAVQADGRILAGGRFTTLGGGGTGMTTRNRIGRLHADGSYDPTFNPGANSWVSAIAVQADGRIVVGGDFTTLGGGSTGLTPRNRIGRLDANGSLDTRFDPGADDEVAALALQADGKVLVGGNFGTLGGGGTGITTRHLIGRLTNTDAALQNLAIDSSGTKVTWERGGVSPEVGRVAFELSTDGATYTPLGSGTRIPGGWQLTGLRLPKSRNVLIRARGFYSSGSQNDWGSVAESVRAAFLAPGLPAIIDFDGDRKSDITVFRPSSGTWYSLPSMSPQTFTGTQWGVSNDVPVPGDYDGDGKTDIAIWRPGNGAWYILPSGSSPGTFTSAQWGISSDLPVPADFDGDGRTDIALWRPSTGTWYILPSSSPPGAFSSTQWGAPADLPVPGDYDGDGRADIALWRPSTGTWYILPSGSPPGAFSITQWGISSDLPVPADFDGDGKTDIALWRPSTGTWYILPSGSPPGTYSSTQWGISSDLPVPGDYDGDGKTDVALWRSSAGVWYVLPSGSPPGSFMATQWGIAADMPIPRPPGVY